MGKGKTRPLMRQRKLAQASPAVAANFQMALAMHQQGQLDRAEALYRETLRVQPRHFDSLLFLGHLLLQTGRIQDAVELIGRAIDINPHHAGAHFNSGVALLNLGRHEDAIASFSRAIELKSDFSEAFNNRGSALQNLGRHEDAIASFGRAIALKPDDGNAHNNRGISLQKLGRHAEAIASFDRALVCGSDNGVVHNNRGISLLKLGRYEEAIAGFDRALELIPDYFEAFINRGIALPYLGRHADALASFDRALALRPDSGPAHNNRGMLLLNLRRYDEAIASFDRAIALVPDYFEAFNNRGLALPFVGRHEEAIASFDRAIEPHPDYVEARNNRGKLLLELNRHEEALASFRQALELRPDDAVAHLNESLCRLRIGDFARGWEEFEWRWQTDQHRQAQREFPAPLWLGEESLLDKTILLHAEQGLGDTIQFCRYANLVAARGATVLLEVQAELKSALTGLAGVSRLLAKGEPLPAFDYHCPLLSLPLAFKTELDTIPASASYLRSDPGRIDAWQARLGDKTLPRIGLVWSGSTGFGNDHNRSIPFSYFARLPSGDVQFVSLQKEVRAADQPILEGRKDVAHFGESLRDFADTAALVDLMDLVITVDTAVAHLAGALGKPVWLLLPFNSDWRWLLNRSDSPWYPSAKLFRQSRLGDWGGVIEKLAKELAQYQIG